MLGASVTNIYGLLTKDILKLVAIATIISWLVAFMTMNRWLENFVHRIEFSQILFLMSGILAFFIAQATVTTQALKTTKRNPVKALKYEEENPLTGGRK